jgi:hypothetical protein
VGGLRRLEEALVGAYQNRYPRTALREARAIVKQVLWEFLLPFCEVCLGSKSVMVGELKVDCVDCGSIGVRRFSDVERVRSTGLSFAKVKHAGFRFSWLHDKLSRLDRGVNEELSFQLER